MPWVNLGRLDRILIFVWKPVIIDFNVGRWTVTRQQGCQADDRSAVVNFSFCILLSHNQLQVNLCHMCSRYCAKQDVSKGWNWPDVYFMSVQVFQSLWVSNHWISSVKTEGHFGTFPGFPAVFWGKHNVFPRGSTRHLPKESDLSRNTKER